MRSIFLLCSMLMTSTSLQAAQTSAQKALEAEPEMQQLLEITSEAQARQRIPTDERPGGLFAAGQSLMDLRQQSHLVDVIEFRLEKQVIACHYCAPKQEELSELIRQRTQTQGAVEGLANAVGGTASTAVFGAMFGSGSNRWGNREVAETEASDVLMVCTAAYRRTPDNRLRPECLESYYSAHNGIWHLARAHETAWAKCFSGHNWVDTPAQRMAYESCMDSTDPLTKIVNEEKKFSKDPQDEFIDRFTVTASDVNALLNYKDRWSDQAKAEANVIREGSNIGVCNRTSNPIYLAIAYRDPDGAFHHYSGYFVVKSSCKVVNIEYSTLAYISLLQSADGPIAPISSPLEAKLGFDEVNPPRQFCTSFRESYDSRSESALAECQGSDKLQDYRFRWSPGDKAPADWKRVPGLSERQHQEFTLDVTPEAIRGFVGGNEWAPGLANLIDKGPLPALNQPMPPQPARPPEYATRTLHISIPGLNARKAVARIYKTEGGKLVQEGVAYIDEGQPLHMRDRDEYKIWAWVSMGNYQIESTEQTVTATDATPLDSTLVIPIDFSRRTADDRPSASPVQTSSPAAVNASTGPIPESAVVGIYAGNYTCSHRVTPLQLELSANNGTLTGLFKAAIPGLPAYDLRGNYFPATGEFLLNPGQWQGRPLPGYRMVGLKGRFDPAAGSLSGNITDAYCGTFALKRIH